MHLNSRMLLLLSLLTALIPTTTLFAQSDYTCDCAADTLNCSDFASPADAQACFWYCGSQGVGDIHQLDLDMNSVACDVITQSMTPPTPEPVYIELTSIPETIYAIPTAVPAYEVCSCGGDYYDCSTFSGPSHAQGCYDYCVGLGSGDVHLMDPDGDGFACLVSGNVSNVPMSVEPTAMPIPYIPPTTVYVAPIPTETPMPYVPPPVVPVYVSPAPTAITIPPTPMPIYIAPMAVPTVYVPPTMAPMMIAPTSTPLPYIPGLDINGKVANPEACVCDRDYYNCDMFYVQVDVVACANHCSDLGYGDIHRLDQGGAENVMCEATFNVEIDFNAFNIPDVVCDCSRDAYNCTDGSFQTQEEAQGCFNYCRNLGFGDIHRIDGNDKDLMACESLP